MRISDWSSDVCSSDLDARHLAPGRADRPDAEGLRRLTPLPARTASVAFGGGGSATLRCACSPPALERRRSTDSHLAGTITWPTGSPSHPITPLPKVKPRLERCSHEKALSRPLFAPPAQDPRTP